MPDLNPTEQHLLGTYKMKQLGLGVCVTILIQTGAIALPTSHSPFFPNEDYTLDLAICSTSRNVINEHPPEGTIEFWKEDSQKLTLNMTNLHYIVQVHKDNEPLTDAIDVDIPVTMPFDVARDAVCSDLNRDSELDFVVTLWLHGNGLGALYYKRLIVLSSRDGYRFWVIPTMAPSAEDFVTFGKLEPIVMVTTDWRQANRHSYFAYDLWTFRDGAIVSANQVDSRFPKWVWMTFTENHKPAVSISNERKQLSRRHTDSPVEITHETLPNKQIQRDAAEARR